MYMIVTSPDRVNNFRNFKLIHQWELEEVGACTSGNTQQTVLKCETIDNNRFLLISIYCYYKKLIEINQWKKTYKTAYKVTELIFSTRFVKMCKMVFIDKCKYIRLSFGEKLK